MKKVVLLLLAFSMVFCSSAAFALNSTMVLEVENGLAVGGDGILDFEFVVGVPEDDMSVLLVEFNNQVDNKTGVPSPDPNSDTFLNTINASGPLTADAWAFVFWTTLFAHDDAVFNITTCAEIPDELVSPTAVMPNPPFFGEGGVNLEWWEFFYWAAEESKDNDQKINLTLENATGSNTNALFELMSGFGMRYHSISLVGTTLVYPPDGLTLGSLSVDSNSTLDISGIGGKDSSLLLKTKPEFQEGATVIVPGSNYAAIERIAEFMIDWFGEGKVPQKLKLIQDGKDISAEVYAIINDDGKKGGSSGGCDVGFGAMALAMMAIPFVRKRK